MTDATAERSSSDLEFPALSYSHPSDRTHSSFIKQRSHRPIAPPGSVICGWPPLRKGKIDPMY